MAPLDRRTVLRAGLSVGGGLCVLAGFALPRHARALVDDGAPAELGAYVRIADDGKIAFWLARTEMGQGVGTSLTMILAEELDVPLAMIAVEQAPADIKRFGMQGTGGSRSIRSSYLPLRQAGAAARALLVAEAAARWKVDAAACGTAGGFVVHGPSGRRLGYGVLARAAAQRALPDPVPLKAAADFRLIGTPTNRLDSRPRVDGSVRYGIDATVPGMRIACVALAPMLGGRVASVDESAARAVAGVETVVRTDRLVAVVARNSWAAMKGRDALRVTWTAPADRPTSETIFAALEAAVAAPGAVAAQTPGIDAVLAGEGRRVSALYRQPFLAHAPMEPMNCLIHVHSDGCEIWTGTQVMGRAQIAVAGALGIPQEKVTIHNHPMGGGFGRRLEVDGILTALSVARQLPFPVKLIWTRSDDIRGDIYRPAYVDRFEAVLDGAGRPKGWLHRVAGSSIVARITPDKFTGVDDDAVECVADPIYALPERRVEFRRVEPKPMPTGWWRGVGPLRSTFVLESFIDELAAAAGADPVAYRRALIAEPRVLAVIDRIAATRPSSLAPGQGWGIAVQSAFGSFAAMAALVSVNPDGLRVERLNCVVDCGQPINPRGIAAQVEGGALFGLSAALTGMITVRDGHIEQGNFDDYPVLRISAAPMVDVEIVRSAESPGGIGELATILVAPAVTNALHAATGRRIRQLPIGGQIGLRDAATL